MLDTIVFWLWFLTGPWMMITFIVARNAILSRRQRSSSANDWPTARVHRKKMSAR